jgi:hypothetical protein
MPTPLNPNDVSVSGDTVRVTGAGAQALANDLVQKNAVTLAEVADALGFVHPKNISIGTDGSVTINSAGVAKKVSELKAGGARPLINLNCNC